jgi:hypothetical protein
MTTAAHLARRACNASDGRFVKDTTRPAPQDCRRARSRYTFSSAFAALTEYATRGSTNLQPLTAPSAAGRDPSIRTTLLSGRN